MRKYDIVVIGAGIAGLSIAEMFSRHGYDILVIDKSPGPGGDVSRRFHEWLHLGSLYVFPHMKSTRDQVVRSLIHQFKHYAHFYNFNLGMDEEFRLVYPTHEGWYNKIPFRIIFSDLVTYLTISRIAQSILEAVSEMKIPFQDYIVPKPIWRYRPKRSVDAIDGHINSTLLMNDLWNSYEGDYMFETVVDRVESGMVYANGEEIKAKYVIIANGIGLPVLASDHVHFSISYQPLIYYKHRKLYDMSFVYLSSNPTGRNFYYNVKWMGGDTWVAGGTGTKDIVYASRYARRIEERVYAETGVYPDGIDYVPKLDLRIKGRRSLTYYTEEVDNGVFVAYPGKFSLFANLAVSMFVRVTKRFPFMNKTGTMQKKVSVMPHRKEESWER